jgi:peroxiredoxin Q/BCP
MAELAELRARIWGISGDYVWSHHEWAKHHDLPFELLSDHDHAVAKAYDSYNAEKKYNKRAVYLIDSTGVIAFINAQYNTRDVDDFEALRAALSAVT